LINIRAVGSFSIVLVLLIVLLCSLVCFRWDWQILNILQLRLPYELLLGLIATCKKNKRTAWRAEILTCIRANFTFAGLGLLSTNVYGLFSSLLFLPRVLCFFFVSSVPLCCVS
jgi:hypothetical protein